jgi:hypothetical protein
MMKHRCLTDEEITAYVDGVANPALRKKIEEHLSQCSLCLHNIAELKRLIGESGVRDMSPPRSAMARAEGILAEHLQSSQLFDITAVLRNGICRILECTGELLPPRRLSTVQVRGEKQSGLSTRVAKSLSGYLVTLELTPTDDDVRPSLMLFEEVSSLKPDGIKAKLYSPGASETKYSHEGQVRFSSISHGFFRIEIEEVGRIRLDIR